MSLTLHLAPVGIAADGLAEILSTELGAAHLDLTAHFASDPAALARDPEPALAAALDAVEAASGGVLVTSAQLPAALAPVAVALHARLATELGAGLVLVGDDADTLAVARAEAERQHATVVGAIGAGEFDGAALRQRVERKLTPLGFKRQLLRGAQAAGRHIVLPEGTEPRIVKAAAEVLALGGARLTLLGEPGAVRRVAAEAGVDISTASIVDPATDPLRDRFASEYAQLRAKKGVTPAQAFERMADVSYFGTMMVRAGLADAMVSGAINTTAHTIRPAFEVIKTKPGVEVVSSVFFMCLEDEVLVFGDCAVNPNPTAAQLADIAVAAAATASAFGFDPRVALLSYSTGTSGTGPDVDLVTEATALVKQRAPELKVDGPLQFDAAVDETVGRSKAPGSLVAGRANVLIFPDLSAGNAGYKAVQRTAGALAIGPVLQGLNKPVNDLSRGALVEDIVNTILITAIQAN